MEERKDHKIYMYTNKINGKVYIGRTCNSLKVRAKYQGIGYKGCPHFYNAIKKYGWKNFEPCILEEGLTNLEATEREVYWIKEYDATNHSKGYNTTDKANNNFSWEARKKIKEKGRHCMLGKHLPEETKRKIGAHQPDRKGRNNPMFGKRLSKESRQQISRKLKKREVSKETRRKIGIAQVGSKNHNYGKNMSLDQKRLRGKKVINLDTGELFHTATEAAEFYKIPYKKAVIECCNGKSKTAGGYHWKYVEAIDK